MPNAAQVLNDIATEANCSPEQVSLIVGRALAALHKVTVCDEKGVTGAIMQCYWWFNEEACYHLGGILEEARMHSGPDDIPWAETYARFAPHLLPKYRPVLDGWLEERSEKRKLMDKWHRAE